MERWRHPKAFRIACLKLCLWAPERFGSRQNRNASGSRTKVAESIPRICPTQLSPVSCIPSFCYCPILHDSRHVADSPNHPICICLDQNSLIRDLFRTRSRRLVSQSESRNFDPQSRSRGHPDCITECAENCINFRRCANTALAVFELAKENREGNESGEI